MPRTAPRDPSFSTADLKPVIYTPDALPQFADQGHRESLHQKDKRAKKLKPTEPIQGAGRGGRLGASATQGLVQDLFIKERMNEDVSNLFKFGEYRIDGQAPGSAAQVCRQEGRRGEQVEKSYRLYSFYHFSVDSMTMWYAHVLTQRHDMITISLRSPCTSWPWRGSRRYRASPLSPLEDGPQGRRYIDRHCVVSIRPHQAHDNLAHSVPSVIRCCIGSPIALIPPNSFWVAHSGPLKSVLYVSQGQHSRREI
jgi:hypothetical protein